MISISVGLLGGLETAAASVGKKGEDGPAFADTFEQAAASGKTKVVAAGTQGAVKVDRGTGQARKASRSAQSDGEVKQAGLATKNGAAEIQALKGGLTGKKIADVAEVVEEQVAGGQGLQASLARAAVSRALAQGGKGRVDVAAKDGVESSPGELGTSVEVVSSRKETPVALADKAEDLQGGVLGKIGTVGDGSGRTLGSAKVAQGQVPVVSGHVRDKVIGASIRPDARGSVDVADAELPVATVQGSQLATATAPKFELTETAAPLAIVQGLELAAGAAPLIARSNGSEPIGKGLTKVVDELLLAGGGVAASAVRSDTAALVPEQTSSGESSGVAWARPLQGDGVSLPKTILQTRQIPADDAVAETFSAVEQLTVGAKNVVDRAAIPAGEGMLATGGLERFVGSAVAPSSTTSVPVKGVTASPAGDVQVASPAVAPSGVIHTGLLSVMPVNTAGEIVPEGTVGTVDGRLSSGAVGTEPLPLKAKNDAVNAGTPPDVAVRIQANGVASISPQVAVAEESGVAVLQRPEVEVAPNRLATSTSVPGQDGSKTSVKSAVRHGERARAKETSAPAADGGSIVTEASTPGVFATATVAPAAVAPPAVSASVVPAPVAAPVPQVIPTDTAANEAVAGLTPVDGLGVATTLGLKAGGPMVSAETGGSVRLAGPATEAVASRVEGLKVPHGSTGQTPEVPVEQVLSNATLTEAGQGIEGRSPGIIPADTTVAEGAVAVGVSELAAAAAPVKAGQERKAVAGAASVGARERRAVAAESKTADIPASAGAVDAGRTVAVANSSDPVAASVKPAAADHRAQGNEGGQVSAAPVGIVNGAAVQAHVASTMPATAVPAASAPLNSAPSVEAAGGAHAASSPGSAESLVSPMAHTTLQATPTVLEVGVPGGTHGWLKIRAEIGEGGAVTASMSASSHAGQDSLRRDLPAMNAFLESEHVPVSLQVVHGTGSSWEDKDGLMTQGGAGLSSGLGQDGQGSARGEAGAGMLADAGTGGGRQQNAGSQGVPVSETRGPSEVAGRNVVEADAAWSPAPGYGSGVRANGGSWLNVVA